MAAGFVVAASVAIVAPHDTGPWLPLHLFLVLFSMALWLVAEAAELL